MCRVGLKRAVRAALTLIAGSARGAAATGGLGIQDDLLRQENVICGNSDSAANYVVPDKLGVSRSPAHIKHAAFKAHS